MRWPWSDPPRTTPDPLEDVLRALQSLVRQGLERSDPPETSKVVLERLEALERRSLDHTEATTQLRGDLETLRVALAEGIEHETRREKRIQATVRRAQKKLEEFSLEDPALESEAAGLLESDGEGSGEGELSALHEDVGGFDPEGPSSIPGVTRGQLLNAHIWRRS